ncbi:MAG TPA: serine/threonine-protein kinase, partial [Vicinamibacterales bacterium]|nr:serine/threonine-protein kinase [Vicinamibacterales bacterium]
DARFPPGRIFAARYRIVSLLGRGATGEVYRADDLKLGQRVALKLLSPSSGPHPSFVTRFITEVRLARDIAHPNVCRVYDIGEADGWHYLSMEYIDGETLASLLRRIGSLPAEKALDVARQLCAGLAAAHDRGVLHRDLKPGNIMLDGRGQVRIVDLGFATPLGDAATGIAGTPAYMAPEQTSGQDAGERTDLYSLGVVLYEVFTGRRLFHVRTIAERAVAGEPGPAALARLSGIDPAAERIIRRCLEADPADRPTSAWSVAAELPGGDALSAALAAGRMPSPEMIAAAGQKGALRPALAWPLLAAIVAGTLGVGLRVSDVTQLDPARVPKPGEVLAERARAVLSRIGHEAEARDTEYWFEPDIRFVYRQSPQYLVSQNSMHVVIERDPPDDVPGIATVVLDPNGRLVRLRAIPDGRDRQPSGQAPPTWEALFEEAQLNQSAFVQSTAAPMVMVPHDTRIAWEGPGSAGDRLRVVGASLAGWPVYFDVSNLDAPPPVRQTWFSRGARSPTNEVLLVIFSIALFVGGGILARRNLRLGYGDTRGGRRLAIWIASGGVLWPVLRAHHVPLVVDEWIFLLIATGWALVWTAFAWLIYISLEPYVRRWWPHTLISWARLLSGRVRDPLVGRDILAGLLAGIGMVALLIARVEFSRRLGVIVSPLDQAYSLEALRLVPYFGLIVYFGIDVLNFSLAMLGTLLLIRVIVRNQRVSVVIWVLSVATLNLGVGAMPWDLVFAVALAAFAVFVLLRFGLFSTAVMLFFTDLMTRLPITLSARAWYFPLSMLTMVLIGGLAVYGFVVALAGRSPFGAVVLAADREA